MSRTEAEALVREKEGRLCATFFRRADGTILTDNCPVGLRSVRDRVRRMAAGLAASFAFLIGAAGLLGVVSGRRAGSLRNAEPFASICNWLFPRQRPAPMGELCPMPAPGAVTVGKVAPAQVNPFPPRQKIGEVRVTLPIVQGRPH